MIYVENMKEADKVLRKYVNNLTTASELIELEMIIDYIDLTEEGVEPFHYWKHWVDGVCWVLTEDFIVEEDPEDGYIITIFVGISEEVHS